ncbi:DNA-binding protein [Pseudomonas sp. NPDC090203]|uniref:DNA-binding protein n=1 Tax=Pseudomonas sp. NPDC090203 TaxID=3364477 RepID=UPI00380FA3D4
MARSGINRAEVQAARNAIIARGENPSIDAVRIEMGNTGSKTTIHRLMREIDAEGHDAAASQIDEELTALVARLASRLKEKSREQIDDARASLDAERQAMQGELQDTRRQLAELRERHAAQTTTLGSQTATLLQVREALQNEQKENARLSQAAQDTASRLADKDGQIQTLKERHLDAHGQSVLLKERVRNAKVEMEKLKQQLTERDQQNRVLELILIKTELALENLKGGKTGAQPD